MSHLTRDIDTLLTLVTGPLVEPLDLDEVKKHLKVGSTSEDTLLDTWISAARQHFEEQTGRQVMNATWEYWLAEAPSQLEIELPKAPLRSVVSISYDDAVGDPQTFDVANYTVTAPSDPTCPRGRVALVTGSNWPTVTAKPNAMRIRFVAGYGDARGDVPELLRAALYLLVAQFHRFRSEVHEAGNGALTTLPIGATTILQAYKYAALPKLPPRAW